jgi:hypothetical protein
MGRRLEWLLEAVGLLGDAEQEYAEANAHIERWQARQAARELHEAMRERQN